MTLTPVPAPSSLSEPAAPRLGRRRAFINHKGGVGKTTITIQMAQALARRGHRVLLVDMDPQANLTRRAAVNHYVATVGEVLAARHKGGAALAVVRCGWDVPEADRIDVLPADLELADRDGEASQPGSFNRLARILFGVTDAYDYTLIDCRPTLGHLEQMVVRALDGEEDGYYLVVEPGADAISGAYRVTQEIATWATDMEVQCPPLGAIVNLYDARTNLHMGRTAALAQSLTPPGGGTPPPVLVPYIPRAVRIAELQDLARPSTGDQRLRREGHLATFDALAAALDR